MGGTKQSCCPECRKGGVCKLNKRVKFIIMMLMVSVDGGKAWALQSRLCSGRLSSFSKGESGSPQNPHRPPRAFSHQTKSGAMISPVHTSVQGFSRLAYLLPGSIYVSSAAMSSSKTPSCEQGSALCSGHAALGMCCPRKGLGCCFAGSPPFPFLQIYGSAITWDLSSTAVYRGLAMSVLCQGWMG